MPEPLATYRTQISGFWTRRHTLLRDGERLGVLAVERRASGLVSRATWRPEKGEVLHFRRDPGILRSQFSLWTEGNEWLGSSLRWSFLTREISLSTGSKPYRLLPLPAFRRGWRMVAPKTGELARFLPGALGRSSRIEVYRKVDFELLVFAYFLASLLYAESFWPAHAPEDDAHGLGGARSASAEGR